MIMVAGAMALGLSVGWYVMAQNGAALPDFAPGQILTAEDLNTIVDQVANNQAALSGAASGDPLLVDCDAGDSLAQAVQGVSPGRTIQVSGACSGRVMVTTDRLTLDGQGTAVLDGGGANGSVGPDFEGVLTVNGARDVTITGFTFQNSEVDGLVASRGAVLTISNITVQNSTRSGLVLSSNVVADLSNITTQDNGGAGIFVTDGARVIFRRMITSTGNNQASLGPGIGIVEGATARLHGAMLQANNNLGDGVGITTNGVLSGAGSNSITSNNNGRHGILLSNGWMEIEPGATINVVGHATGSGIFAIGNGTVVNVPSEAGEGAAYLLENNAVGLNLDVQGAAFFIGGLTVRNNDFGILASGANTLTVVSIPPNPSNLSGNTSDVDLSFGTRSTFDGVPIDTITCDATVLSRGSTICP